MSYQKVAPLTFSTTLWFLLLGIRCTSAPQSQPASLNRGRGGEMAVWHHFPKHPLLEVCPYMERALHFLRTVGAIPCRHLSCGVWERQRKRGKGESRFTLQGRQTWPLLPMFTGAALWLTFLSQWLEVHCYCLLYLLSYNSEGNYNERVK